MAIFIDLFHRKRLTACLLANDRLSSLISCRTEENSALELTYSSKKRFSVNPIILGKHIFLFDTCMDFIASSTLYRGIILVSKLFANRSGYLRISANGSPTVLTKKSTLRFSFSSEIVRVIGLRLVKYKICWSEKPRLFKYCRFLSSFSFVNLKYAHSNSKHLWSLLKP